MTNVQVPSKRVTKLFFMSTALFLAVRNCKPTVAKSCIISNVAIGCENVINIPKRTATPRVFSSIKSAANRTAENICSLTEVSLIARSLKLFSWQKFVSAPWAKYIRQS